MKRRREEDINGFMKKTFHIKAVFHRIGSVVKESTVFKELKVFNTIVTISENKIQTLIQQDRYLF